MARTKGIMNKNSAFLMKRLQDMYGKDFDPIMKAAENAMRMENLAKPELTDGQLNEMEGADLLKYANDEFMKRKECVVAWDKIANYTLPKLKAIEHSGEIDLNDAISDEERTERVATILEQARARRDRQPDQTH